LSSTTFLEKAEIEEQRHQKQNVLPLKNLPELSKEVCFGHWL
jgi:hypothetical protein